MATKVTEVRTVIDPVMQIPDQATRPARCGWNESRSIQDENRVRGHRVFRNLFKRHTGMKPGEYRDKFSQMSFERGELI